MELDMRIEGKCSLRYYVNDYDWGEAVTRDIDIKRSYKLAISSFEQQTIQILHDEHKRTIRRRTLSDLICDGDQINIKVQDIHSQYLAAKKQIMALLQEINRKTSMNIRTNSFFM